MGLVLLFCRAWPRLIYPEIWDEDGTQNLYELINHGIPSLFKPVNGYLIIVPKLITFASAIISISYYPEISTILAWGVTIAVFWVIATAPSQLGGGIIIAAACLLVPTNPEVFGLPLYTFWWVSLLLFVLVFWKEQSNNLALRIIIIFLASLSSPVCIVVLPLLWMRVFLFKNKKIECIIAILASICVVVQILAMYCSPKTVVNGLNNISVLDFFQIIPKFFGGYAIGNLFSELQWPIGILVLILFSISIFRNRYNKVIWGLLYLWVCCVIMSMIRVPIKIIHQAHAGPRYFFYPFMLQSWLLIQFGINGKNKWLQKAAILLLVIATVNTIPVIDRKHDALNWRGHLISCTYFDKYFIPVHFNGVANQAWKFGIFQAQCAKCLNEDYFYKQDVNEATFSYRIVENEQNNSVFATSKNVIKNDWIGADAHSITSGKMSLHGMHIHGSYIHSDSDTGELILRLNRGDQIWYRSGPNNKNQKIEILSKEQKYYTTSAPSRKWTLLEFSNKSLPQQFDVKFSDDGVGWGEWSAVALKNNHAIFK